VIKSYDSVGSGYAQSLTSSIYFSSSYHILSFVTQGTRGTSAGWSSEGIAFMQEYSYGKSGCDEQNSYIFSGSMFLRYFGNLVIDLVLALLAPLREDSGVEDVVVFAASTMGVHPILDLSVLGKSDLLDFFFEFCSISLTIDELRPMKIVFFGRNREHGYTVSSVTTTLLPAGI